MQLNEALVSGSNFEDAQEFASHSLARQQASGHRQATERSAAAQLDGKLIAHYAWAGSVPGHCNLHSQLAWRRLCWRFRQDGGRALKRTIDFSASLTLLILLSPLLLLIALLVKLEDGGPVLFAQTRVGRFGKEFKMFKLRSMCLDAEARLTAVASQNQHGQGITFKIKNDPRITRVGRWLRKFSLDELPQLYNVFIGDMSLVGPRPPLPREVRRYKLPDHRRLAALPGITCIWQISGRSEINFAGQVKLDVDYIECQSFWTDTLILLKTIPAVIASKGAC
jgi:lipopolysaccharide/colanic/teichoic acid biosynthesis glycosyltransferase